MDDKSLSGAFSQFLPDTGSAAQPQEDDLLVTSLKSVAGLSGGELSQAVDEFLGGKGELHATTRAAVAKGGASPVKDLAALLTRQFKLNEAVAELAARLLVKLLPKTEKEAAAGKKPRKAKPKPKPAASAKTSKEKKKPKTTASAKKPKPKPKTAAKPKKKSGEV